MKKLQLTALSILMFVFTLNVNAQFTNYTTSNSDLPANYVCGGVAIDTNNFVWVGTDAGVAKFDGTTWSVYTISNGLPSNIISCIAVDKSNNIWVGSEDGVAKYNGSTWTEYTRHNTNDGVNDSLCDNAIHYIACDTNNNIWFGSWGAGVSKFNGTTWTTYNVANGFPNDAGTLASIYYITVDGSNNKWFGSDMGLIKYDNSVFTTIDQSTAPDLRSNYITAVAVDDANNKWLGVLSKGIAKFNSSNAWVANYDTLNGIRNNGITDIKFDSEGNIWLGEYTIYGALVVGGITKFNSSTENGISYSGLDGLFDEQVFRIAIDSSDNIWIATGGGLFKFVDAIGIEENYNKLTLDIYPNPAHEYLNIDGNINSGIAEISDITGRLIINKTVTSAVKINTETLVNGVYFIKITDNEKTYYGKFIKE